MEQKQYYRSLIAVAALILMLVQVGCKNEHSNPVDPNPPQPEPPGPKPPIVKMLTPQPGNIFADSLFVNIFAEGDSALAVVQFYINEKLMLSWNQPPYTGYISLQQYGDNVQLRIMALALDNNSLQTLTAPASITVKKLAAPSALNVIHLTPFSVKLNWRAEKPAGEEISIERSTDGKSYSRVGLVKGTDSVFVDNIPDTTNRYYYRLQAVAGGLYRYSGVIAMEYLPDTAQMLKAKINGPIDTKMIKYSPNGKYFCILAPNVIYRCSAPDAASITRIYTNVSNFSTLAYSPDGKTVALGGGSPVVLLLNIETGLPTMLISQFTSQIIRTQYSPDGRTLYCLEETGNINCFNTENWLPERVLKIQGAILYDFKVTPDGSKIVAFGNKSKLYVWEAQSGILLNSITTVSSPYQMVVSPDGKLATVCYFGGRFEIYDIVAGVLVRGFTLDEIVDAVSISPDGKYLAMYSRNRKRIVLKSAKDLSNYAVLPTPEESQIMTNYSADGGYLASYGDYYIYIYNLNINKKWSRFL